MIRIAPMLCLPLFFGCTSPPPDDRRAREIYVPDPEYPPYAYEQGIEGYVVLDAEIDESGDVAHVDIIESSTHRELVDESVETVSAWRYLPRREAGEHVETSRRIYFIFCLPDATARANRRHPRFEACRSPRHYSRYLEQLKARLEDQSDSPSSANQPPPNKPLQRTGE